MHKGALRAICILLLCVLMFLGGLVACRKKEELPKEVPTMQEEIDPEPEEEEQEQEEVIEDLHEGKVPSFLTGLWIDEDVAQRRPVAVMINNHKRAWPHHGLSEAEIIYETLVEGEMVRLMAIFQDFNTEKIGPIRSARHYYLDFAFDHDAIYVHYGQSIYAHRAFTELKVENLNGLSWLDEIMCWRDMQRWKTKGQEHSAFTNKEKLMTAWDKVGYRKERNQEIAPVFYFLEENVNLEGENAEKVSLPFSYYLISEFEYDATAQNYKRFQSGEPHIDANTGEQLRFKNIIIQFAEIWTIKGDPNFCRDMNLITEGDGLYITNGKLIPITWKKTSHRSPTQFFDSKGKKLEMNKGNTWISVYPKNKEYDIK